MTDEQELDLDQTDDLAADARDAKLHEARDLQAVGDGKAVAPKADERLGESFKEVGDE
jgi:hypothetical protein